MARTPTNTPILSKPGPPLETSAIPPLPSASEQDFLGPVKLEPIAQLIRKSLKRALDIFVGNVGIETSRLWEVNEPKEKRIRIKLLDDYNIRSSDEEPKGALDSARSTNKKVLALEGKSVIKDLQLSAGVLPAQTHAPALAPFSGPQAPLPDSTLVTTKKTSGSSDALQHLVFRRPLRIPKAAHHQKWELMKVISGHQGWVRALSVDPSNEWFVSGGNDRLIKIWDLATGQLKLSLTGHINTIRALEVSHRHPYLFSCGEDQMVKCWDLEYNKVIRHYHGHLSGVYSMALHPSLDILSTGGRDAVVRVWDMRTKVAVHVLSGHTGTVMSLASQKPEPQIISGSLDKMIRCWDLVAGRSAVVLTHHKKAIRALALHPREYTFCSGAADHLKVWKCPMGQFERNLEPVGTIINSIGIRDEPATGSGIVVGGSDQGHLHFWDWGSGQKFQTIETIPQPGSLSGEKAIYALKFDMSETRLLTAECDKTIKIWRETAPGSSTAATH